MMRPFAISALLVLMTVFLSGCLFTKVVTVPMRLGGAVISIVPVGGNVVHDSIDLSAEAIDELPF